MESPLPAHKRAEILVRVAGALGRRADEAARQIAAEAGKPLKAARVEVARAMSTYTMAAVEARTLAGEMVPMDASAGRRGQARIHRCAARSASSAAISPFNFPLNLVAHKIAPALAAGCAVVLKPASQTPLSALLLAELEDEAGLPPGWLNVVVGPSSEIGDVLVEDERVKLITFTGSSDGRLELRERAPRKKVNLELGNATPVIVEADADVEDAATRCAANAFSFAGQSCISVQRIYVHRDGLRRLQGALPAEGRGARRRRPGRREHRRRPADLAGRARPRASPGSSRRERPARRSSPAATLDGELLRPDGRRASRLPTRISPATRRSARSAPCSPTTRSTRRSTARTRPATASRPASSRRRSRRRCRRPAALEFGGVTVNEAPTFRADQMPYGGVKDSGNTREGPAWAVREMTEERLVVVQL